MFDERISELPGYAVVVTDDPGQVTGAVGIVRVWRACDPDRRHQPARA